MIETLGIFIKLGRHVAHDEMMNPIDFGGQKSKVEIDKSVNNLVDTIQIKLFLVLIKLRRNVAQEERMNPNILGVRGQGHNR